MSDPYCCTMMKVTLGVTCDEHKQDCPDMVVRQATDGSYGIPVHDGGSSMIEIGFCPWCGKRLDSADVLILTPEEVEARHAEGLRFWISYINRDMTRGVRRFYIPHDFADAILRELKLRGWETSSLVTKAGGVSFTILKPNAKPPSSRKGHLQLVRNRS